MLFFLFCSHLKVLGIRKNFVRFLNGSAQLNNFNMKKIYLSIFVFRNKLFAGMYHLQ